MERLSHNVVISCLGTSLNIFTAKLFTGLVEPENFAKSCICITRTKGKHHLRPQGFNMVSLEIINLQICPFLKHTFRWTHGGEEKIRVIGPTRVFKTQRKKISSRYCVLWPKLATKIFRAEPVFSMLLLMRQKMSRKLKLCMSFVSCDDKSTSKCQIDTRHACLKLLPFKECIVRVQIDFRQFAFWDDDRRMCMAKEILLSRPYISKFFGVTVKFSCMPYSTINVEIKIPSHFGSILFCRKTEPEVTKIFLGYLVSAAGNPSGLPIPK